MNSPVTKLKPRKNILSFGPVLITGGPHAGKVGIYDDDKSNLLAVVYLEPTCHINYFNCEYDVINKSYLTNVASAISQKVAH